MNHNTVEYEKTVATVLNTGHKVEGTTEILGTKQIFNPELMLIPESRKSSPFYVVGEFLWYASGSNKLDFIKHYSKVWERISDDGETCRSAYGHLLMEGHGFNQLDNVIKELKRDIHSRRAILQFYKPDFNGTKDTICTLTGQFIVRDNKLFTFINMRSNDLTFGQPYDVVMFSLMAQYVAYKLGLEMGSLVHSVASLHIYDRDVAKYTVQDLDDFVIGDSSGKFMLTADFWEKDLPKLIEYEERLRIGEIIPPYEYHLDTSEGITMMFILQKKWGYRTKESLIYEMAGVNNGLAELVIKFYEEVK